MSLPVIGVDFDNTLVSFDHVLHRCAVQWEMIPSHTRPAKRVIRDLIRQRPDGEAEWRRLQAWVYGPGMAEASLIDGVARFFRRCQQGQAKVYVVSHKTEFSPSGEGISLRHAATAWMERQAFFDREGLGLSPSDVFFESTRQEKIDRIRRLRCTHFIDDLPETFRTDMFPPGVEKLLYDPHGLQPAWNGVRVLSTWPEITAHLFP